MIRLGFLLAAVAFMAAVTGCSKSESSSTPSSGATTVGGSVVAAQSKYDSGPRAGEGAVNEELASQGSKLFKDKGCSACHAFGTKLSGPDLKGVSMRRTATWMENQILHPDLMVKEDPIARELFAKHALQMPNQGLTADEARAIIEYLKHQDHESGLTPEKED